jgi:branched-chain amino acid transport system permease protein
VAVGLVVFGLVVSTPLWASAGVSGTLADLLVAVALAEVVAAMAGAGVLLVGLHGLTGFGAVALVVADERLALNPVVAVGAAAAASVLLGVALVPLVLRLSPVVASLATWVAAEAAGSLAARAGPLEGGGVHGIEGVAALGQRDAFAASLAVVLGLGSLLSVHALRRSAAGLALRAAADASEPAAALDLPLRRARLVTWLLSAGVAGAAGAVAAFHEGTVEVGEAFSLTAWTLPALVAVGVGGVGSVEGPLLGAVLWAVGAGIFDAEAGGFQLAAAGLALAVQCTFGPAGLWGRVSGATGVELFPAQRRFDGPRPGRGAPRRASAT